MHEENYENKVKRCKKKFLRKKSEIHEENNEKSKEMHEENYEKN